MSSYRSLSTDPFWREHGHQYRGLNAYTNALEDAARRAGRKWKSVFVMSDSQTAIGTLSSIISNMTRPPAIHYDNILDRTVMEQAGGHVNVPQDQKRLLQDHFVACVHLSGQLSSHVVGTLSSNVFKVLLQLIAAHKRLIQVTQLGFLATSLDTNEGWAG